jgi:hypothetical protein
MSKFLLLSPLIASMFALDTQAELIECVEEFGCTTISSKDVLGNTVLFAVALTQDALLNLTSNTDLPGVVVEYVATYDQALIID